MPSSRRSRLRTCLPVLVLSMLLPLLAACGGDPSGDDPGAPAGPGSATGAAASSDESPRPTGLGRTISAEDLTARLADVGVVTYAEAGATEPVVPVAEPGAVALTSWQVRNQALQLNEVRGYLVTDLDPVVQTGDVPLGAVLAAWARDADTPGAALARELMGDQEWARDAATMVWPDTALTLFVNDVATDDSAGPARITTTATAPAGGLVVVPAAAVDGLCTDLQKQLSATLDTIVQNLQVAPSSGVTGVLGDIWNAMVKIAADTFSAAVGALTAPILKIVRGAATVLAVVSAASSVLDPWSIEITANPGAVHFAYGSVADQESTFTASVTSGIGFEWPPDLVSCAGAAGVDLPDPGSAKGSPVTWHEHDNGAEATVESKDDVVNSAGQARLRFKPGTETIEAHEKGPASVAAFGVGVDVRRTAVDKLITLVESLLLDTLPAAVQPVVQALLGPVDSAVRSALGDLVQASSKGNTFVNVGKHGPPVETPAPVETSAPGEDCETADGVTAIPDGTWEGPIELDVLGSGNGVAMNSKGGGTMRVVVEDGKVVGGPWSIDFTSQGGSSDNDVTVKVTLTGHLGGKVKGTASAPVAGGTSSLKGSAKATAMGVTQDVPIDETSSFSDKLTVESTSCDAVTATWLPSFNTRTNPAGITIEGTARWVGQPVG